MTDKSAIDWHTSIATDFDAGYSRSANFKQRFTIFSDLIKKNSAPHKRVIDLGCGAGIFSAFAATLNYNVAAIDGSEAMIAIGKKRVEDKSISNIRFLVKDITELTGDDVEKSDLIICSSVLEYIRDIDKVFSVFDALLNDGGTVIVSIPNKSSIYRMLEKIAFTLFKRPKYYGFVKNVLPIDVASAFLTKRNFEITEIRYFCDTPILSRLLSGERFSKYTQNLYVIVADKKLSS